MSFQTIGVCGLGWTGSGAVIDLLKEYAENEVNDKVEFNICYIPDGLLDLEYHVTKGAYRFYSGDVAITRFKKYIQRVSGRKIRSAIYAQTNGCFCELSNTFVDSIVQLKWQGAWCIDSIKASKFAFFWKYTVLNRLVKHNYKLFNLIKRDMFLCVLPECYMDKAKCYIHSLLESMNFGFNKNIILDQPFPANNPTVCFDYFDNPKAIIVDRDPRDLYLLMKYAVHTEGIIPTDTVDQFIAYYKITHNNNNLCCDDNILHLQFEDLIYNYDKTVMDIEKFLSISNHSKARAFFQPEISINNTMLFKKFPKEADNINCIERELKEYLYSFPESSNIKAVDNHLF